MKSEHDDALAGAILETVRLPLLALDADLRVETANEAFLRQFRVSCEETIGQRIYELGNGQWDIPDLRRLLGEVLGEKSIVAGYRVDHDFERIGCRIMHVDARRIVRPGEPDLILLAISDDTEREALRAELIGRIELADKLIDSMRESLLILDGDLRVHSASASFYKTFGVEPAETVGHLVYELGKGQWDIPELRRLLEDVLPRQRSFDDFEMTRTFEGIGKRIMLLNGRRLDHMDLILLAVRDVTDIRDSETRLKEVASAAQIGVFESDRRAGTTYWSPEMRAILGYPRDRPPPPAGVVPEFVHPDDRPGVSQTLAKMLDPRGDGAVDDEHRIVRPDGEVRWVQMKGRVEFAEVEGERRPVVFRGLLLDVTERKVAEQRVRESEQRFRNVLDGMGEAFGLMDRDLRIITQNKAAVRLDGRSLEEIRGWSHWEVYPGSEESELGRLYKRALAGQTSVTLEHRYEFPTGSAKWLEMRAFPVPEGLAVFWRDITERKEAETALRESEQRYRSLFQSMDEAYAVVEVIRDDCGTWSDFVFLEVNPAFMQHTSMPFPVGKRATELLGSPNPRWAETYGRVVETGEAVRIEEEEPILDRIFDLNIFRLGGPKSRRVAVLFTDVTARRRAEAALRESEERFRLFGEASSDALWIRDADTLEWEYLSPAFERIYGLSREEALRRRSVDVLLDLIVPEDREATLSGLRELRKADRNYEYRIRRPSDGELRWLRTTAFRLAEPDGAVRRLGGISQDITDEKHASERMEVLVAELQHRTRNLIGVIQAISSRTLRSSKSLDEFKERFGSRLSALARANSLLSRLGGKDRVTFDELLKTELLGHGIQVGQGASERVTLSGPQGIRLPSGSVQTLALALHELLTNASKHGALRLPTGKLAVSWSLTGDDGRKLRVEWRESGLRASRRAEEAAPGSGFGRELIERALTHQLGATVMYELGADGLTCVIELPA